MTRDCAIDSIREHIKEKIIKVGQNSAKSLKANEILLPVGGIDGDSNKLQNKKSTYEWAKRIRKEANDYFKAKFFGNVVEIDNVSNPNGTIVNLTIKTKLVDHYVEKEGKLYSQYQGSVDFILKAGDILSSDKAIQWFQKADKNQWRGDMFWDKLNKDLQVPKEQIELLKGLEVNNPYNREELLTSLLASYSYTIEVNVTKGGNAHHDGYDEGFRIGNIEYNHDTYTGEYWYSSPTEAFVAITGDEYMDALKSSNKDNSSYYSNLTVPGGTNYTENEIKTPAITPNIPSHAQFASKQSIGWFRSDEEVKGGKQVPTDEFDMNQHINNESYRVPLDTKGGTPTKTRRILEVQSDLFQKGRDKENLTSRKEFDEYKESNFTIDGKDYSTPGGGYFFENGEKIDRYKFIEAYRKFEDTLEKGNIKNQFLQLLNKDSNWVTFFVKSIIQDSAKKGYEKVLFPTGNTASKVEGHETLESFKREKEEQIKFHTEYRKKLEGLIKQGITKDDNGKDLAEVLSGSSRALIQYKDELDSVEREGFGALKPIYNFYENTVTNILKKQGYSPKVITDEYGNTWNEVIIDSLRDNKKILLNKYVGQGQNTNKLGNYFNSRTEKSVDVLHKIAKSDTVWNKLASQLLPFAEKNNVTIQLDDVEYYDVNDMKAAAYYDSKTNRISIAGRMNVNENMAVRTLIHEILHSLTHSELSNRQSDVARHMNALFLYAKSNLRNDKMYPLTDVDEFIVGVFEDGEFIEKLKSIPAMGGIKKFDNLFEQIMNYILGILGFVKGDSLYEQAMSVASHVVTEQARRGTKVGNGVFAMETKEPDFRMDYIKERLRGLKFGEKSYSVRPDKQKVGVYKVGNAYYRVKRLNEELKNANEFPNISNIKKGHLNNEDKAIYSHIQDFYDNKIGMYVYEVEKLPKKPLNEPINNAPKASKFTNRRKLDVEQEVYFTRLMNDLSTRIRAAKKILEYEPYNEKVSARYNSDVLQLDKVRKLFDEYKATNNRQILVDLGNELLDEVDEYITKAENDIANGQISINAKDLISNIKILRAFEQFTPLKTRVGQLFERINPSVSRNSLDAPKISIISLYALELAKKATGKYDLELSDLDNSDSQVKDIASYERWVGSLAEVENYLAKSVGYLIKTKHAEITRENRNDYNKFKPIVEGIEKYAKKNNMSVDKVFEMFTQTSTVSYKGKPTDTLTLVKPFKDNFYKKLNEANKLPKSEQTRVKLEFASYNTVLKRWEPKSPNEANANYKTIMANKELSDFYKFWQDTMKDLSTKIPLQNGVNFIPNIAEQSLLDIIRSGDSIGEKFKDIIENITKIHDANTDPDTYVDDENLLKDDIVMRYTRPLSPELKSTRLDVVLLTFMQFANNYNHMTEILPMVRTLEEEIKNKQFIKNSDNTLSVSGEDSNIYKMVKDVIEMQVKGKMKADEKYAPYIDFGLRYTSLLRIGLNPFNALTNIFIGTIGNIIEAVGGRYFTVSEFSKAQAMFFAQVGNKTSLVNKLTDKFNPLQEMEDYENLTNIKVGSKEYRESVKSLMYAPQRLGEKMMQTATMIAHLMHTKITTKDGKSISMLEAFNQDGKWNTELMGYELTEDMIDNTTSRIHRINQMIHGRYSAKVAATAQQYSLIRAALQFKKWIPAAIEARLQSNRMDHTLGYEIEGRYLTAKRVFIDEIMNGNILVALENLLGPLLFKAKMMDDGNLSEMEIYNMRKNLAEVIIIAASLLLIAGLGDDDKDKRSQMWYKFTMNQLDRISGDLLFFYKPGDMSRSVGVPMLKTVQDLSKALRYMPYAFGAEGIMPDLYKNPEYKSGPRTGENKGIAATIDVLPGIKQFADIYRMGKKVPFQEFKRP